MGSDAGSSRVEDCTCLSGFVLDGFGGCYHPSTYLFNASAPDYPLDHTFAGTYATRALEPVAGYDNGTDSFLEVDASSYLTSPEFYWKGGVLGPDGLVYLVPHYGSRIGVFDPVTNLFSVAAPTLAASTYKYWGGALAPNGLIIFAPYGSDNVGVFNPVTDVFSTYDIGDVLIARFAGCVLGADGQIYFVPYQSADVGIFNPVTSVYSTAGVVSIPGSYKFIGGVLAPNGRIVFVPSNVNSLAVFDPATSDLYYVPVPARSNGLMKYFGGVLAPNGKIYFTPTARYSQHVAMFDPVTGAFDEIDTVIPEKNVMFDGAVLARNGKIWFLPRQSLSALVFDPATNATYFVTGAVTANYAGGVLAPNGKIICVPYSGAWDGSANRMKVGVFTPGNTDPAYMVAGGVPQACTTLPPRTLRQNLQTLCPYHDSAFLL